MPVQINGDGGISGGSIANGIGMVLIKPTSVSGATLNTGGSVTFTSNTAGFTVNGVFSSTYENYRIITKSSFASNSYCVFRMTSGGVQNGSSNYVFAMAGFSSANVAADDYSNGTSDGWRTLFGGWQGSGLQSFSSIDLFGPANPSVYTSVVGNMLYATGPTAIASRAVAGQMSVSTSYDGFAILPNLSVAMTGQIWIYGYNNG